MVATVVALALALAAPSRAAAQAAPAGRLVRVPGAELHVREQGRGEPLLLLHGFRECATSSDPFVEKPAARHRVIVVALRGHGRSTDPSRTFTMRRSAEDVLAVLDSLRLPRGRAIQVQ
jgi:pimeloyl-ACP methyl ester carboxylesterase